MKTIKSNMMKKLGCYFALALGILAVTGLYVAGTVRAVESQGGARMQFSVNIQSVDNLSVTIGGITGDTASIDITPNYVGGIFGKSDEVAVTVATNNATGYKLNMSSTTGSLNDNTGHAIEGLDPTVTAGYTEAEFTNNASLVNKWGYSLKSGDTYGNYKGLGTGVEIDSLGTVTNGKTANVKFGAKVDASLPAGSYETTIVFTAVTNPALYMQDVAMWKSSVAIGESITAIDNRDQSRYFVTRIQTDSNIPDGRADCTGTGAERVCSQLWMTQNLDLQLRENTVTYTHLNTDLGWSNNDERVKWAPQVATIPPVESGTTINWENSLIAERSYDFGDTYYYTSGSGSNDTKYTSLANCKKDHTEADCKHYHAGNLYNFYAATALGAYHLEDDDKTRTPITVSNNNYTQAPNSICPAGWRLPTGLTAANGYSDFGYLLAQNGVTNVPDGSYGTAGQDVGYADGGFNKLRVSPLWIVRSGSAGDGSLDNQGYRARYWSSTVNSSGNAYTLNLYSTVIRPAYNLNRAYGFSVRCLAR